MLHSGVKYWLLLHTGWTLYYASDVFGYSSWYLLKGQLSNVLETQVYSEILTDFLQQNMPL